MKRLFYLLLLASVLLAACSGGEHRRALDTAYALINDRPDSALVILDSLEPSAQGLSHGQLRRWQLLRLMAQNKCDTVFRSDSLQRILTDYYDRHGTPNERMWAHYLLGRAYYDMGEALPALKAYEDATAAADTTASDCDFWNLCRIYHQEALLLYYQNLPDEIFETLDNACQAASKAGDEMSRILCYEKKALAYERLGKTDSMAVAGMVASAMFHDIGQDQMAARSLYWVFPYNIENGDYNQAKKNMDVYEGQSGYFDKDNQIETGREHYYSEKGKYYLGVGVMDSAEACFRKCLSVRLPHSNKISKEDYYRIHAGLHGLAIYYDKVNVPDSAAKYAMLSEAYNDSTYKYTYISEAIQMKKLYDQTRLLEREKELENHAYMMSRNIWLISILSLSILVIGVILLLYLRKRYKEKAEREKRIADNNEILSILKEMERNQTAQTDQIVTEKDDKVKSEGEKFSDNLRRLEKAIQLLLEQNKSLGSSESIATVSNEGNKEKNKYHTIMKIKSVGFQPHDQLNKSEWNEIERYMENKHAVMLKKLREIDKITEKDYQICLLTMLGISTSFIGILIGTSSHTVSMAKKRIIDKLTGKEGSGKELLTYLQNLDEEI